jgi:ubiquinone/menaquinone biosynthesis C-methylase UbiE
MTRAAAPMERVGPDPRPPIAPAQAAALQEACAAAAAIHSAIELGVVARITEAPADPAAVAADCRVTRQGAEALLTALAGLELLELGDDGCFRPAFSGLAELARLLVPWASLGLALRGEWRPADAATVAGAESLYPTLVSQLAAFFRPSAEQAAELLARPGMQVLDVGAGAAPWSLALAARDPSCRVTAVELPGVMTSTRDAVQRAGLEDRYEFVEGNAFDVDWGEPATYDLALVANLCHLFAEDANLRLLRRVAGALRPGGRVAIVDILPNERGDGPRPAVLYALGLVLRTGSGQIYPYSAFRRWLSEGGLEDARRHSLPGAFPFTLITAQRR